MMKLNKKKVEVQDHWRHELTKLRCWMDGYSAGRNVPGNMPYLLPGQDVLRQIIMAIDEAK
jgi:hypothetical protein